LYGLVGGELASLREALESHRLINAFFLFPEPFFQFTRTVLSVHPNRSFGSPNRSFGSLNRSFSSPEPFFWFPEPFFLFPEPFFRFT
jgi:hypothetical protein